MPSNKSSWKENSKMMHRPRQAFIYIDLNKHQRKTHSWLLARYNSIAIFGKTFKYLMRQRHRQGTLFKPTPLSINNSATFAIYHKSDANLQNIKRYVAMHLTGITPHIAIGRPHFRTFLRILTAGTKDGSVRTDGWMVGTEPNRTEWTTGIPIFGAIFIIFQMSFAHKSLKSTWYIEPSKSRSKQCWRFHLTLFEMGFFRVEKGRSRGLANYYHYSIFHTTQRCCVSLIFQRWSEWLFREPLSHICHSHKGKLHLPLVLCRR